MGVEGNERSFRVVTDRVEVEMVHIDGISKEGRLRVESKAGKEVILHVLRAFAQVNAESFILDLSKSSSFSQNYFLDLPVLL
jgi:hypothetical protein